MGINFDLVGTLGTAKAGKGGEYFKPGHNFHVAIEKCEWLTARDGREFVIISTQIINSDCPTQGPGRKPAEMIHMNKETGQGNLASFLRPALTRYAKITQNADLDPKDDNYWNDILMDRETLESVLEAQNILVGTDLYLYTRPITTRAGKPFTVHDWSHEPTQGKVGAVAA